MKLVIPMAVVVLVLAISTVTAGTCPDGSNCDGECCKRFPLMNKYWCCRGIFKCRSTFGIGFCFLYSEPKPQAITHSIESEEEDSLEDSYDESEEENYNVGEIPEDREEKIAFADTIIDVLREKDNLRSVG